jgi:F0F1-type ATP synthase assembly protein I
MPEVDPKSRSSLARLSSIGIELVAAIVGFTLVGYFWDRHFGTQPWGVLIGALLGLAGGMYNVVRQSLTAVKETGPVTPAKRGDDEDR